MGRVYTSGDQFSTDMIKDLFLKMYPVGSIYLSVNSTNPASLFGGTWERIKDRFLLAAGDTYANGATGGSATVALTEAQMPSHSHTVNSHNHGTNQNGYDVFLIGKNVNNDLGRRKMQSGQGSNYTINTTDNDNLYYSWGTGYSSPGTNAKGSGQAHENMPPYLAVYVWKRTA